MASEQANKRLVREYLEAFNDRDEETLRSILASDVVEHGLHEELHGPDAVIDYLQGHLAMFPDYAGETEAIVAEDETVVVRYSVTGTHTGAYRDVEPTGHTVEWTGMAMYRFDGDRIAEIWLEEDSLGLLEQLEAVDPPGHLRV